MARPSPLPSVRAPARSKRAVRRSKVSRGRTSPSFATISRPSCVRVTSDRGGLCAVADRVFHEVPAQDSDGVGVDVRHDGPARQCQRDAARRVRAPKIVHDDPRDRPQIRALVHAQSPSFRPRKLHQAFGKARQPLQRRLDLGRPRFGGRVARLRPKPLRLRDRTGEGCPQFMRGIGREAALGREGRAQPDQKAVQGRRQRDDLRGEVVRGNLGQIPDAPHFRAASGTGARERD